MVSSFPCFVKRYPVSICFKIFITRNKYLTQNRYNSKVIIIICELQLNSARLETLNRGHQFHSLSVQISCEFLNRINFKDDFQIILLVKSFKYVWTSAGQELSYVFPLFFLFFSNGFKHHSALFCSFSRKVFPVL